MFVFVLALLDPMADAEQLKADGEKLTETRYLVWDQWIDKQLMPRQQTIQSFCQFFTIPIKCGTEAVVAHWGEHPNGKNCR